MLLALMTLLLDTYMDVIMNVPIQIRLKILWQLPLMNHIEEKGLARLFFVPSKIGQKNVIVVVFD